ncbi:hypothetical protein [Arthrobacter sp. D2-10]
MTHHTNQAPPESFSQDPENPNLWWGTRRESEAHSLCPIWTSEEGLRIAVEPTYEVTVAEALTFASDLAGAAVEQGAIEPVEAKNVDREKMLDWLRGVLLIKGHLTPQEWNEAVEGMNLPAPSTDSH